MFDKCRVVTTGRAQEIPKMSALLTIHQKAVFERGETSDVLMRLAKGNSADASLCMEKDKLAWERCLSPIIDKFYFHQVLAGSNPSDPRIDIVHQTGSFLIRSVAGAMKCKKTLHEAASNESRDSAVNTVLSFSVFPHEAFAN